MSLTMLLFIVFVMACVSQLVVAWQRRAMTRRIDGPPFSSHALDALAAAESEARALGRASIAPEHLLLALTRTASPGWWAALGAPGLDATVVRADVMSEVPRPATASDVTTTPLPFTSRAHQALRRASAAAAAHQEDVISEQTLALALAHDQRSLAGRVLRRHGVSGVNA